MAENADQVAQLSRRRRRVRLLSAVIVVITLVFGCVLTLLTLNLPPSLNVVTRSTHCPQVASAFFYALKDGDVRLARALAVSDEGVDEWMAKRRGFACPFSLDIESSMGGGACGGDNGDTSARWSCGYSYTCTLRGGYHLRVQDIELEVRPAGCRVTRFSEPCEEFGWGEIGAGKCYQ